MADDDAIVNMHAALRALKPTLEKRRKRYRLLLILGAMIIVTAVAAWVLLTPYTRFDMPLATTIAGSLIPSALYYQVLSHFYRTGGKKKFIKKLSETLKFSYKEDGAYNTSAISDHKIIPSCSKETTEDGFEGDYKGTHVTFQDVFLDDVKDGNKAKNGRKIHVFNGLFIRIRTEKPFSGHTVVIPNNSIRAWFKTKFPDFKAISIISPQFERFYDVMSTDQVEARIIMNTSFTEKLMQAKEIMRANWIEVSFLANEALIVVARGKRLFEPDPLWQKITTAHLQKKAYDIEIVMQLIDILKLNRKASV